MCPQYSVTFADNTESTVYPHPVPRIKSDLESWQNWYKFDFKRHQLCQYISGTEILSVFLLVSLLEKVKRKEKQKSNMKVQLSSV